MTDAAGAPLAGVSVTVIDTRTNSASASTTDVSGGFSARGLRVGGPYTVLAQAAGYGPSQIEDITVSLGDTSRLSLTLDSASTETIIVTTSRANTVAVAVGPTATFTLSDIESAPTFNRSINDVVRLDPRVYVDEGFVDAVQCAGANPRFNSLTVDGIRLNDAFGLNSNGFPTERMPFSYDAIEQVAVELAPFDVEYGGFTACNINAVTKSGTNEIHGGAFYDFTSDDFRGDSLEGADVNVSPFEEKRYGFNAGGPIIPDRLFIFGAYEKFEGANNFDRGPVGSGAVAEVAGFTQANFDRISQIAQDVYGYDPGGTPSSVANEDEKILVKVDWNVTDDQRATFTYNFNDGFNATESDGDSDEFEYANHLYERGAELQSYAASLYSDWTDNFSTELRASYADVDPRVVPLGGTDFGEVQITVDDGTDDAIIYLGADDSRHSNELDYTVFNLKAKADYGFGDHLITVGAERETTDVFNLFIQETEGEYRFSSIDDFEAGTPNRITYENAAGTNNPVDGGASFSYSVNTVYLQDEWNVPGMDLTVTGGLRYDWYTTDDAPPANAIFLANYGFSNDATVDGEGLLQPRLGFSWEVDPAVTVRGGVGLYSGGNPNVWLSNNYSNNGVSLFEIQDRSGTSVFDMDFTGEGRPIYDVPQDLFDAVAAADGQGPVNALDPDFELPREWKYALGATWLLDLPNFGGEFTVNGDLLYTDAQESAAVQNLSISQIATGPLGEPVYTGSTNDYLLTNSEGAESFNASVSVSKEYDSGVSWTFGYAYSDAQDVNPMTSAVAFSNHNNLAFVDPNDQSPATSNYNIRHRFTLLTSYEHAFFGDYLSKATLFASANEGRPFSYTFSANSLQDYFQEADSSLLYIPTGLDDPNVDFSMMDPGEQTALFDFIGREDLGEYAGGFLPRNEFEGDWWTKLDLRLEQEFPGVRANDRSAAFLVVENLGNLINDEWGILREASFPRVRDVVDASYSDDYSQYVFESFSDPGQLPRVGSASLWSIRIGVKYDF